MDEFLNQIELCRRISGKNLSQLTAETGLSRASLCTVLGRPVNGVRHSPNFGNLLKVANAVGATVKIELPNFVDRA